MDASRVRRVREEMERAGARRLQPHYIESFFREAFRQLGGSARQREPRRYQVSHVPALIGVEFSKEARNLAAFDVEQV